MPRRGPSHRRRNTNTNTHTNNIAYLKHWVKKSFNAHLPPPPPLQPQVSEFELRAALGSVSVSVALTPPAPRLPAVDAGHAGNTSNLSSASLLAGDRANISRLARFAMVCADDGDDALLGGSRSCRRGRVVRLVVHPPPVPSGSGFGLPPSCLFVLPTM